MLTITDLSNLFAVHVRLTVRQSYANPEHPVELVELGRTLTKNEWDAYCRNYPRSVKLTHDNPAQRVRIYTVKGHLGDTERHGSRGGLPGQA